ncbi:MAG: hypothetical protein NWF04_02690 [Candidatus Bathyarchaeota archaeon]|nr:hypothetical protein [Candidatus Bathyarchaeota archaeon]
MKKIIAVVLVAVLAVGSAGFLATAQAAPFMNWNNGNHNGNMLHGGAHQNAVRLTGVITEWGTTEVTGSVTAQSRTVVVDTTNARQGSTATAVWTTSDSRPIDALRTAENFTYTFYSARLVNAGEVSLDTDGYASLLTGEWNVFEMTTAFTVITDADGNIVSFDRNQHADALATNVYGELAVAENGNTFTLNITGIDQLSGTVRMHHITNRLFNPFKLGDDTSTAVTPTELATMAHAYGAMPGWGNYDQSMDYNFDYKIGICDITTAAANMNA